MILAISFDALYKVIGWLLAVLYVPLHSLGLAIIVMTFIVMAVQFPLIKRQTRGMVQMQRVQPEIKKIQQKYKDDKQKQNEELLKFYQENKINPLASCLPMLLTVPIGIAVFGTFRHGIQKYVPESGSLNKLYVDLCGSATTPVKACGEAIANDPPATMHFLGMNLNWSASKALNEFGGSAVLDWLPYFIVLALVIFTGWYQVRQTQARQLRSGTPINAQMQMITRIMPVFFGFISYGLSAATTIYFFVSNAWRIGQQHFVLNKIYEEEHIIKHPKPSPPELETDAPPGGNGKSNPKGSKTSGPQNGAGSSAAAKPRPASGPPKRKKKRKR